MATITCTENLNQRETILYDEEFSFLKLYYADECIYDESVYKTKWSPSLETLYEAPKAPERSTSLLTLVPPRSSSLETLVKKSLSARTAKALKRFFFYLVGIEPNPGPTVEELREEREAIRLFMLDFNDRFERMKIAQGGATQEQEEAFIIAYRRMFDHLLHIDFQIEAMTYDEGFWELDFDDEEESEDLEESFIGLEENPGPTFVITEDTPEEELIRWRLFLVGIEPNPGPMGPNSYNKRNVCSKSTHKGKRLESKLYQVVVKNLEKKHEKEIREMRNLKNYIRPEGMFDSTFKLDDESVAKINMMLTNVLSSFQDINIKHQVSLQAPQCLKDLLEFAKEKSMELWNLFVGFFKLFLKYFYEGAYNFLSDMFLGDVFLDAYEIQPEIGTPWSVFASMLYFEHFSKIVSECDWRLLIETLTDIKKTKDSIGFSEKFLSSILRELGIFIFEVFGISVPFLYEEDAFLRDFKEEAKIIWGQYSSGSIDDYAFADRVSIFINEIENSLYDKRKSLSAEQKEHLTYLLRKFQPVAQYCMRYVNPNNGPRIEPMAIVIGGPTGAGKSSITVPLLLAVMGRILPQDKLEAFYKNHNDFLFFRNNENEFWDGYKMRNVAVVYDDFGQRRDIVGAPNADAFEIIRLKNTAPYHLHFSAIEDKQRNFATPKLIFATTNLQKMNFPSLTCSPAVIRRFDLSYIQVPKSEYSVDGETQIFSRKPDMEKIRRDFPLDVKDPRTYFVLDVIEYIPWDFSSATQAQGPILSFWELVDKMEEVHNNLNGKGNMMLEFHKYMKVHCRPEMNNVFNMKEYLHLAKTAMKQVADGCIKFTNTSKISQGTKVVLASLAGLIGAGYYLKNFFTKDHPKLESNTNKVEAKKGTNRRNIARHRKVIKVENKKIDAPTLQMGDTKLNPYLKLLKRNTYLLSSSTGEKYGWVTFLYDRVFMIPKHFMLTFDSLLGHEDVPYHVYVNFTSPFSGKVNFAIDWSEDVEVLDLDDNSGSVDMVFVKLRDQKCRIHSDITGMFPSNDQLRDGETFESHFSIMRGSDLMFLITQVRYDKSRSIEYFSGTHVYKGDEILPYNVTSGEITYSAPSDKGDCGSILLTCDPRFSRPTILGFHAASAPSIKSRICMGVHVTQKHIQEAKNYWSSSNLNEDCIPISSVQVEGFTALGEIEQPRVPSTSKIEKSEMADDLWETKTKPAHLGKFTAPNGETIDPAEKARAVYSHDEVHIDSQLLNVATTLVAGLVLKKVNPAPWEPRLFSFSEAVKGIAGVDYIDSINRSSSPGYPYCLKNKGKGKQDWFGKEDFDFESLGSVLVQTNVQKMISKATMGIRTLSPYVDYLKDERRPTAKVDIGKTRQFMAGGMDYLIASKMYFGDFIRSICSNHIHNGIAVGINPYEEWNDLVKYMCNSKDKKMTAGDYSGYDAKIPVEIGYAVLDIVEMFYGSQDVEDVKVRSILWLDVINSLHVSQGKLYEFVGGNPSGQFMTTIFNSIANLIILTYIGLKKHTLDGGDVDSFIPRFNRTRFQVFGDDNIISYEPSEEKIFSQQIIEGLCEEYIGMKYTNEHKDGSIVSSRTIDQITFLKRGFRFDGFNWKCPLDIDVLKETLSWQKQGSRIDEMRLRIECVLSEIARHGERAFNSIAPRIISSSIKRFGYVPVNRDFYIACASDDSLAYA